MIPKKIYQTWHTAQLPPYIDEAVNTLKKSHPDYEHLFFDHNGCRQFIKDHFEKDVLEAYDALYPWAFKADLWRYCALYQTGGVYIDVKFYPVNNFNLNQLTETGSGRRPDQVEGKQSFPETGKEYLCKDLPNYLKPELVSIYNAFMICAPGNDILYKCIRTVVENVKKKYYGYDCLCPTGPHMVGTQIIGTQYDTADYVYEIQNSIDGILWHGRPILKACDNYREEQMMSSDRPHYSLLWHMRWIYFDPEVDVSQLVWQWIEEGSVLVLRPFRNG